MVSDTILSTNGPPERCGPSLCRLARAGDPIQRLGWSVLTFWCVWFAWQTYRGMWLSPPALMQALQAPRVLLNAVPFFLLLAVWFALFFPMRKREERDLQQEIDELRAFENQAWP